MYRRDIMYVYIYIKRAYQRDKEANISETVDIFIFVSMATRAVNMLMYLNERILHSRREKKCRYVYGNLYA